MKTRILNSLIAVLLLLIPALNYAQAPPLGTAADFVIFTTIGAVGNTGISHLTGNVGTNNGGVTGFGNVNGVMTYTSDPKSALCATDLLTAYNQLNSTVPSYFPAPLLGNGDTLIAGVYSITGATTMNGNLYLNALGNPNAVFIFQIQGPLSTAASSKVILLNGAKACNVFWKIEGLVSMAPSTTMKGTIIANNAAINMSTGCTLEGRVLSTNGAVNVSGVLAYTPIGCGSPALTGPLAPSLVSATCYTIFSSNGPVTNAGITNITGDVGTNVGLTTGFDSLFVIGAIHPIPDGSTAAVAADLLNAYSYLNTLPYDIELLYPAQFGNQLVLTPHTYLMSGAVTFTDTLFLDAMNDTNAVFVIKIYGAINTSTYSKVKMINGTQSKNVYWMISGAVSINDYSEFVGTIVCNNGAMNLNTGVKLDGRALTTTGALNTAAITAIMPPGCGLASPLIITEPVNKIVCAGDSARFSVTATGSSLTYQWRKGNVNLINGGHISGATSDTLKINPANSSDTASNYNVIVSGSLLPNDTSINVSLVVNTVPIITTEPTNKTTCIGSSVSFSVTTSGTVLTYQWRKGNVNLINGGSISGVNSDTLTINPVNIVNAVANYNVIITGSCLPNDTSVNASLVVNSPPIITAEPANKTTCIGNSVYFSVTATGSNLTYQWRKGTVNIINGGGISGATSDTLRFNPMLITDTASNYNVIVSGTCLPKDTSINVSLLRSIAPIITTEPNNIIACAGNSVSFSVIAIGTNLSYQWRKGTINLTNGGNILGANSNILTINPLSASDTASNYNVIVSGTCLPNDTSINVSLLIINANITTGPVNQIVCAGNSASFSVVAIGAGLTYQWRKGTVNLINGGNISGATSATLTINPANISDTASNYNVVVSDSCTSINSSSTAVDLKSAGRFGIIAGVGISSTGFSKINNMDVGISPGVRTSITGFPPATVVNGAIYASDDIAPPGVAAMLTQVKQDLADAYLFAEGATAPAPATVAGDQGGLTLAPGIYKSTSTLLIQSGDLTLDAQGNANAFWIFQIASDFTTVGGAGGNVILSGGAQAKNIIWQVGSSATIGNGTSFKGNILALTSITMNTGSSIDGRLLARNGAVVLSGTNIINSPTDTSINITTVSSANVSLGVNPLPITSVISGNATPVCNSTGNVYSVINTSGSTYLWTVPVGASITLGAGTNSITVTFGTANGNIGVVETNSNNCNGIKVIKAISLSGCGLNADFDADITSVCNGSSVIFTDISTGTSITTTYNWNFGANATPSTAIGIGPHTVIYTGSGSSTVSLSITDGVPSSTKTVLNYISIIPNNTIVLSSAVGTNNQTHCINTAITNITYSTTGATGATFSGLPAGVTGNWLTNVVTISGTPTASGTFNYTVTLTGGCGTITAIGTITVSPNNTIVLSSAVGTNNQTHCINTTITNITYSTTGATGATFSGLPAGVTGNWLTNVVTISGTPTASGTFNYTVTLTGGCGIITATGTITVSPNNTIVLSSAVGTNNQTHCINTAITNITYSTTGATGATFSGLPAGVTGNWLANVVTISGTPTASGTFNYTVTLTGGCGIITAVGTITVSPNNTIVLSSAVGTNNQTHCINTAITNITYSTTGATGATFSGLPAGVTGNWLANVVTISGTPTASGTFNYTVTLSGGCGTITATGTITVSPNNTIVLSSAVGSDNQTKCINTAITNITYSTTGATGATFSGLPAGVTGNWLANVVTISGTPIASGTFNYTVTLTGGCGTVTATGTITVNPITGATSFTLGAISVCQNASDETYTATAANSTSILYSVLPATAGVINATTGVMNWDASFSGVATITAVSSGLCGSTTNNLIVTVIALPIASASGSSPVCINSSINLTAQTVTGGTYLWAGPNGFTSAIQNPVILSATLANSGLYSLTVSVNTCTSTVSNVTIVVKDCPADLSVVKTVDNTHPKVDHNVVFNIVASNNGPYDATGVVVNDILQSGYTFVSASTTAGMFYPSTGVWVIGYMNIGTFETLVLTARVNSNGSYINTASITGVETDGNLNNNISTVITYPTNFFIPEGFSPNGDGINDVFVITGIDNYSSNTFTIFNRWGNKVYEASPYQNNWDGTSSFGLKVGGDELPTGTYFYILNLGNNTDAYKGTIYLNR